MKPSLIILLKFSSDIQDEIQVVYVKDLSPEGNSTAIGITQDPISSVSQRDDVLEEVAQDTSSGEVTILQMSSEFAEFPPED